MINWPWLMAINCRTSPYVPAFSHGFAFFQILKAWVVLVKWAVRDFVPWQISTHFNFNRFRPISKRTEISSHNFGYGMIGYWICDETCMGRNLHGTKFVNEINRTKSVKGRGLCQSVNDHRRGGELISSTKFARGKFASSKT